MGKMKEIEAIQVVIEGFELCEASTASQSVQVKSLEEFINSEWLASEDADKDQLEMNDVLSQFKFKEL